MNKPGDPPPSDPSGRRPFDPDISQTLPEGSFDKTLPEGLADENPQDEASTMVGAEPAASTQDESTKIQPDADADDFSKTTPEGLADQEHLDEASTMVSDGSEPVPPDGATMVSLDPNKTTPEGLDDQDEEASTMLGVEPDSAESEGATMVAADPNAAGEFDTSKTAPDGLADDAPAESDKTMVSDESDSIGPDGATMVALDPNAAGADASDDIFGKTMPDRVLAQLEEDDFAGKTMMMDDVLSMDDEATMSEEDFGKTMPAGSLAQVAEDDFAGKTMMMDSAAESTMSEDDFAKTAPEGIFDAPAQPTDATMLSDGSGTADQDDGFGKTVQADAFGKTIADEGTIVPDSVQEELEAKTIVGTDSAVEGNVSASASSKTIADPKLHRTAADSVLSSRATRTGGRTSIDGTEVLGADEVEGIDKESLNVAMRSIAGLQYGVIPRVDFKLVKQLGEGGMGVVYVAKQQSLGREVVFKTLKPIPESQATKLKAGGTINSVIKHRTDMFLSEAVVTADLFHPNIVPIYELAKAPDGSLFYTMKWVRGDGWHKRIKEMSIEENLEVLMKVCDAIGFAHSRHIVNRDLKPENVMLGGYGETIVLDWGLALPFGEGKGRLPLATTAGLGSGTPAYMPPELITGPLNKIGPACDIYLLGAMLFEVITGVPPHDFSSRPSKGTMSAGAKMAEIRRVVVENVIRDTEHSGELMDIARKAMASKPEDRYRNVTDLQNAIRDYQKHAASRTLVDRAKELTAAQVPEPVTTEPKPAADAPVVGYSNYQNALALYNESLREWPGNHEAREGLTETQLNFAKLALTKGDYDLGLSVLDTNADTHTETRTLLVKAREERDGRVRVMKVLKTVAAVLVVAVFGLLAVAAKFQLDFREADRLKTLALDEKKKAEEATEKAQEDQRIAEREKEAAKVAADKAIDLKNEAVIAKDMADEAKKKAEKQAEDAKLAAIEADKKAADADKKAIEANEKAVAANKKAADAAIAQAAAEKLKIQADKDAAAALVAKMNAERDKRKADYQKGLADATRIFFEGNYPGTLQKLADLKKEYKELCGPEWDQLRNAASAPDAVSLSKPVESMSLSRDGRTLVVGDNAGRVAVWSLDAAGKLVDDQPIRDWNLGIRLHAVAISPDGKAIAAAGDDRRIRIWFLKNAANQPPLSLDGHTEAVYALKFSSDGKRLVSGGDDRVVRLWSVDEGEGRALVVSKKLLYSVRCVDWSRDDQWLVAGTSAPEDVSGVAYSWRVKSNNDQLSLDPVRQFQVLPKANEKVKQNRGVVAIALTTDGRFAVSNGPAAELHLWQIDLPTDNSTAKQSAINRLKVNTEATQKLGVHSNRVERVRSVAFSQDGLRLFAAGDDGTISIWTREKGDHLPTFTRSQWIYGHGGPVRNCLPLPQSPDLIVSGSYDRNVHLLDVKMYFKTRKQIEESQGSNPQAAVSPALDSEVSLLNATYESDGSTCDSSSVADSEANEAETLTSAPARSELVLTSFPQAEQKASQKDAPEKKTAAIDRLPSKSVQIAAGLNYANERLGYTHPDFVLSAVFSRDGKRVISSSRDQTARAWNSETGLPIRAVTGGPSVFGGDDDNVFKEGHEYDLFTMRFFPNGQHLLTSGFDGEMRIWDARIDDQSKSFGRELAILPYTSMYGVVDISRDGEWILTAGRGSTRRTPGVKEAENVGGEELAGRDYEAQAQLWSTKHVLANRHPRPELKLDKVHRFRVTAAAISPDNSRLLTGDREGRIVLWDAKTGKVVGQPQNVHSGEVVKIQFLEDGSRLLTVGVDRRVMIWNVKIDSELRFKRLAQFDQEGLVVNLAVSPRYDRFISVISRGDKNIKNDKSKGPSSKVSLWKIDSGEELVIDIPSRRGDQRSKQERDRDRAPYPAWAADGTHAIITTSEGVTTPRGSVTSEGVIHFFDSDKAEVTRSLRVDNSDGAEYRAEPYATILRPDEPEPRHLITQTHNAAFLWRLKGDGGEHLVSFRPQGPVFSAGYSSDGRYVVTGGRSVRVFDADENKITFGRPLYKIEHAHEGIVTSVEFTPAENSWRFLTTGYDGTAKIWDWDLNRRGAQLRHTLTGHAGPVRFGTWSADGSQVLTVGHDANPHVWSFPPNEEPKSVVLKFPEAPADVKPEEGLRDYDQFCGAFSWDGQFVAVGGQDVETGESIGWIWNLKPLIGTNPELYATIRGHGLGGIKSVAFLPDDDRLLTGGADGTARLWDWQKNAVAANSGKIVEADFLISLVRPIKGQATTHRGSVNSVRVTRNGNIVTASSDGTVLIWPK